MMPDEISVLLGEHEVIHAVDLGWRHLSNGKLLAAAESEGFEVLLTKDANMPYQQNMVGRSIALLVLRPDGQSLPALLDLVPRILHVLPNVKPGSVTRVAAD